MASRLDSAFRPFEGTRAPHALALFRIVFFAALALHFFPSLIQLDKSYVPNMMRTDEWSHWLYLRLWRIPRGWLRAGSIVTMVACVMGIVGFRPRIAFEAGLRDTVNWYVQHRTWWERIKSGAFRDYYDRMYANR